MLFWNIKFIIQVKIVTHGNSVANIINSSFPRMVVMGFLLIFDRVVMLDLISDSTSNINDVELDR